MHSGRPAHYCRKQSRHEKRFAGSRIRHPCVLVYNNDIRTICNFRRSARYRGYDKENTRPLHVMVAAIHIYGFEYFQAFSSRSRLAHAVSAFAAQGLASPRLCQANDSTGATREGEDVEEVDGAQAGEC
jgi:hypothetical protein